MKHILILIALFSTPFCVLAQENKTDTQKNTPTTITKAAKTTQPTSETVVENPSQASDVELATSDEKNDKKCKPDCKKKCCAKAQAQTGDSKKCKSDCKKKCCAKAQAQTGDSKKCKSGCKKKCCATAQASPSTPKKDTPAQPSGS